MKITQIETAVEAVLFASGDSVNINTIAQILELDTKEAQKIVRNLSDKYIEEKRGVRIIKLENSYQMCTSPEHSEILQKFFNVSKKKELTQPLLETLAIIAYKQPITKPQIEEIRGVNADHAVNKLMEYNLICEKGRLNVPGKPILFGTTEEFLKYYGFSGINALPELKG